MLCSFLLYSKVNQLCVKSLSRVRLFVTPGTVAHQAPPSMEFSRQEYWSGLPLYTYIFSLLDFFPTQATAVH